MPVITPQTTVRLLSGVPLDPSYRNTVDFGTAAQQLAWFNGYVTREYSDFTYQRTTQAVRVPAVYDDVIETNYVMYLNSNFGSKWIYAFVTDVRYVNPGMSELQLQVDPFQTFLFDWEFLPCYILREHVQDDNPYHNTKPEGLEIGPLQVQQVKQVTFNDYAIVLAISAGVNKDGEVSQALGQLYQRVYSGVQYYSQPATSTGVSAINAKINELANNGYLDDILSVFMVPQNVISGTVWSDYFNSINTTLAGYTPKNKKLLGHPYRFLQFDNYQGGVNQLRFELFANPTNISWGIACVFNQSSSMYMYPCDYAGETYAWREGIGLDGFPQCTWVGNTFSNYNARNKTQMITKGVSDLFSLATGNTGAIGGIASGIANFADRSLYPYQARGQEVNQTVNVSWKKTGYNIAVMTITAEYAKMLDDFFSWYGYKVDRFGIPLTKSRVWWNYVQTERCSIKGQMPEVYIREIERIFDQGVTIWHQGFVGDYTQNNLIVDPAAPDTYPSPTAPPMNPNVTFRAGMDESDGIVYGQDVPGGINYREEGSDAQKTEVQAQGP